VQTDGISWLFVGDVGLRRFIAQEVDRLDDIISFETDIFALTEQEYKNLLQKRIEYYRLNRKAELPVSAEVFAYLFEITKGRLRYIFGLLNRLMSSLYIGDLTDCITLEIAKPMIAKLARERVSRNRLSQNEEQILKELVKLKKASATELAKEIKKSSPYVSKVMTYLAKMKLIESRKQGRSRTYFPILDVEIAYGEKA
jgi:DNA-binding MarR family transcriptional regulator